MSNLDDWIAEAHAKGRIWYTRRRVLAQKAGEPSFTLAECERHARVMAKAKWVMDSTPDGATDADKARFIEAFVKGAVEAWHALRG